MDRDKASRELIESFIRMVNRFNSMEKHPISYGTKHKFYHSERHMMDTFGDNPDMNITELAEHMGVTKGAISQIVSKLEKKGAVHRYKADGNDKDVLVGLTKTGKEIYEHHKKVSGETVRHLKEGLMDYSDESLADLLSMFKWIEDYLGGSGKHMELHKHEEK